MKCNPFALIIYLIAPTATAMRSSDARSLDLREQRSWGESRQNQNRSFLIIPAETQENEARSVN